MCQLSASASAVRSSRPASKTATARLSSATRCRSSNTKVEATGVERPAIARSGAELTPSPGVGLLRELDHVLRHRAVHDVGERHVLEHAAYPAAQCDPHRLETFGRPFVRRLLG